VAKGWGWVLGGGGLWVGLEEEGSQHDRSRQKKVSRGKSSQEGYLKFIQTPEMKMDQEGTSPLGVIGGCNSFVFGEICM